MEKRRLDYGFHPILEKKGRTIFGFLDHGGWKIIATYPPPRVWMASD
jgi:hypothetical protein